MLTQPIDGIWSREAVPYSWHELFVTGSTKESSVADLAGSTDPKKLKWADGAVTRAFTQGKWCLLDNIHEVCRERGCVGILNKYREGKK